MLRFLCSKEYRKNKTLKIYYLVSINKLTVQIIENKPISKEPEKALNNQITNVDYSEQLTQSTLLKVVCSKQIAEAQAQSDLLKTDSKNTRQL